MSVNAIQHIEALARARSERARCIIKNIVAMTNISPSLLPEFEVSLSNKACVSLHFHPDRLDGRGKSVAQGLLKDGEYKSQFETHLSNGMLSPVVGGPRDHWENQLFGNSYIGACGRPKYGALDFNLSPNGAASRFGSCYFICKPEVSQRASFCYLDSYRSPAEKGTLRQFDDVLAALLSEAFERDYALGLHFLDGKALNPQALVHHLNESMAEAVETRLQRPWIANLDHYIEAQIHGKVSLYHDVDYLLVDPSFRGTAIQPALEAIAKQFNVLLYWHCGRELNCEQVPSDFRGAGMPSLAQRIAVNGIINAHIIGEAVANLIHRPKEWENRGNVAHVLQELKLLWHVVVKFGYTPVESKG